MNSNTPTSQTYPATGLQLWIPSSPKFFMKACAITVLAILLVGLVGSVLSQQTDPWQNEPATISTLAEGSPKKNLTDLRAAYRDEYQKLLLGELP